MFNVHLTANLSWNLSVKKILKSVKNWQNDGHDNVAPFFGPPWSAPCISETEMLCCGHGGIYNNYDNIYGAVITTKVIARVHLILSMNADSAPVGVRQPSDQANRLACKSAENWQLPSTSVITIVIITQPVSWYSFYRPMKGGRLSPPKHCSKGAQPVPTVVYQRVSR